MVVRLLKELLTVVDALVHGFSRSTIAAMGSTSNRHCYERVLSQLRAVRDICRVWRKSRLGISKCQSGLVVADAMKCAEGYGGEVERWRRSCRKSAKQKKMKLVNGLKTLC